MGCTLYAMAFGTCPFESPVEGIMKLAILDANFSFPKNNTYHCCSFSNPFCKFIRMMLRLNIEDRITIDDCIEKTQLLIDHCPKHEVYWGVCSESHSALLCLTNTPMPSLVRNTLARSTLNHLVHAHDHLRRLARRQQHLTLQLKTLVHAQRLHVPYIVLLSTPHTNITHANMSKPNVRLPSWCAARRRDTSSTPSRPALFAMIVGI